MGDSLDINNLDQMGYFGVPSIRDYPDGETAEEIAAIDAFNASVAPLIAQYGYVGDNGETLGGGGVGAYYTINNQDFARESFQVGFDTEIYTGEMTTSCILVRAGLNWKKTCHACLMAGDGSATLAA
ncbi:MAG: hypothetical protein SWN10_20565 [Pseudomonadota bacterium]|nr:hypothetical protein [Pseudomonadota bacterium]